MGPPSVAVDASVGTGKRGLLKALAKGKGKSDTSRDGAEGSY